MWQLKQHGGALGAPLLLPLQAAGGQRAARGLAVIAGASRQAGHAWAVPRGAAHSRLGAEMPEMPRAGQRGSAHPCCLAAGTYLVHPVGHQPPGDAHKALPRHHLLACNNSRCFFYLRSLYLYLPLSLHLPIWIPISRGPERCCPGKCAVCRRVGSSHGCKHSHATSVSPCIPCTQARPARLTRQQAAQPQRDHILLQQQRRGEHKVPQDEGLRGSSVQGA